MENDPLSNSNQDKLAPGERTPPPGMKSLSANRWVEEVGKKEIEELDQIGVIFVGDPQRSTAKTIRATRVSSHRPRRKNSQ